MAAVFYPYLWQGVFAGGWLLCRPDPLALPARQVLASDALALALGHLGVLAGGLFSQDIRHAYWYRPAAMTLVFWLASLLFAALSCAQPSQPRQRTGAGLSADPAGATGRRVAGWRVAVAPPLARGSEHRS